MRRLVGIAFVVVAVAAVAASAEAWTVRVIQSATSPDAQIKKMAKQLRAGAEGYATLRKTLSAAQVANRTPGVSRAVENIGRLQLELDELAWHYENVSPESWIHGVRV